MLLTPGSCIGAYEIKSLLGAGGMGEVYRARDTKLGRDVALKTLRPDTAQEQERLQRFRREARAIATLNHPHIVTIYSVEEIHGIPFFTMELIEGEPLSHLIAGNGLPIEKVFTFCLAISDALAAAHEKGIVHRDLKPENIVVDTRGNLKVLDFGLAKLAPIATFDTEVTLSRTGDRAISGTLPYMSPEQLLGQPLDTRTDIFSAGVIFYEMATGTQPFMKDNPVELASAILRDSPKSARLLRSELPSGFAAILDRCLEKKADHRYGSALELHQAIEALQKHGDRDASIGIASRASIAVLPFLNLSADRENEFFADGITEEIINVLSQVSDLHVVARSSAFSFKGKQIDLRIIGEQLNVCTVLEGSVRKAGTRLRITAQLVNVADGYHLWSQSYNRELEDVFEIQEEIARAIARKLEVTLAADKESPLVKAGTTDLEAYQLYLKGRILLYRRGIGMRSSLACFEQALELDPKYAQATASLAENHAFLAFYGFESPENSLPECKRAAERAVNLDPELAEAHYALACAFFLADWNHQGAGREFRRALELNPRYVPALALYGFWYLGSGEGRFDEGIRQVEHAVEIDPRSSYAFSILAFAHALAGHFQRSFVDAKTAVSIDPESFLAQWVLLNCAHWVGDFDTATSAGKTALALSGRSAFALSPLALTFSALGKTREAGVIYKELLVRVESEYVSPSQLAGAALAVGHSEEAFQFAEQAFTLRDPWFKIWARYNPDFEPLRRDARYLNIVKSLGAVR